MASFTRRSFVRMMGMSGFGIVLASVPGAGGKMQESSAATAASSSGVDELAKNFAFPPDSARPWVYWFWLDGNITREGVTADLEAMKAAGIGGVLIMEVSQGTPPGPVRFGSPEWRDMFDFMCCEAARLGLQVNMNNDGGWCGSGGPWITPELSMQVLVWTSTQAVGGKQLDILLPQPQANAGYYEDALVLAYPTPPQPQPNAIVNLNAVSERGVSDNLPTSAHWPEVPPGAVAKSAAVINISGNMNHYGRLLWNAPAGNWTILRLGHTTTNVPNHPAPAGGLGLESDKLSERATLYQFEMLMGRLIDKVGPLAGGTLVSTHIDSWEIGSQNWTRDFPSQFKRLRGYDMAPYLPAMTGQVIDSMEVTQRFLWDVRKTISQLLIENYSTAMRDAAAKYGLRLSIEGYSGVPTDEIHYGGSAVEPMSEFWAWPRAMVAQSVTNMTSAGHVYGHNIIGQETFTSSNDERWQGHPAVVKDLGDWAFAQGVNRFVVHRYAMQPFNNIAPGVSMGPWGLHYERTQTWWRQSLAWHRYLARCQHLLRQGHWVADVLYLQPEGAPSGAPALPGAGNLLEHTKFKCDGCPADVVLHRLSVKNGMLCLPEGICYKLLVIVDTPTMTPELLAGIKKLADAGAKILGSKPLCSPSLADYPQCDADVKQMADELWSSGKIMSGKTVDEALAAISYVPDFTADTQLVFAHRQTSDADIYFVANQQECAVDAACEFRSTGTPDLWDPQTGEMAPAACWQVRGDRTRVLLKLGWKQSLFVVFRHGKTANGVLTPVIAAWRNNNPLWTPGRMPLGRELKATYGPAGDAARTRDVTAVVAGLLAKKEVSFPVVKIAAMAGDPAFGVVKTLRVTYRVGSHTYTRVALDGELFSLMLPNKQSPLRLAAGAKGDIFADIAAPGRYRFKTADGKISSLVVTDLHQPTALTAPWQVTFPPDLGAPAQIHLKNLISLADHPNEGVKYFSGTANYSTTFEYSGPQTKNDRVILDLGDVAVMAQATLNAHTYDVLWKPPFELDITEALRAGENHLQVAVTNLWINRLIGDAHLPEDAQRNGNGSLAAWPAWVLEGKRSPTGRISFTTWELWHKTDSLVPSGLMGPVRLRHVKRVVVA
ncbi:MAG: glycosyl hydrolase [Phycisphaerae bacterium]